MKTPSLLIAFLPVAAAAFTCGNEYGYSPEGKRMHTQFFFLTDNMLHHDTSGVRRELAEKRKLLAKGGNDLKKQLAPAKNAGRIPAEDCQKTSRVSG